MIPYLSHLYLVKLAGEQEKTTLKLTKDHQIRPLRNLLGKAPRIILEQNFWMTQVSNLTINDSKIEPDLLNNARQK